MMVNKIRCNDEGSLLLSTFHLLLFISFLILSLTAILQHQMMQLQLISQAYEAKALIEVSEELLRERLDREDVETGTIYFSEGRVDISKETDTRYTLAATMPNHYTSRRSIEISAVENVLEPEIQGLDEEAVIGYSNEEPVSLMSFDFLEAE
ncbi:MAG: hypothetical protein R6U02_00315 [Alkalibacterium sp.]|uniref:hypothetical protein n=1 Tax=Alkalibacterium sp. TaxID=1872447 RepID=UPI003970E38F